MRNKKDRPAILLATEKNMVWWELPPYIKDALREEACTGE